MASFEFVRLGIPCTVQTVNKSRLSNYKADVRRIASTRWRGDEQPTTGPVKVTITYFYMGSDEIDVDNIIKPVLDQLNGLVYEDDRQIVEVTCRKRSLPVSDIVITGTSPELERGLRSGDAFLHIRAEWESVMEYKPKKVESPRVREAAQMYRTKGYDVTVAPEAADRPAFLYDLDVDLIAKNADESVVVEVKAYRELGNSDRLGKLIDRVENNEGWRVDLVLDNTHPSPTPTTAGVSVGNAEILRLLSGGLDGSEVALVQSFAALEAALRLAFENFGIKPRSGDIHALLVVATSRGFIEQNEFDTLKRMAEIREAIVHGYERGHPQEAELIFLAEITRRVIDEAEEAVIEP